MSRDPYQWYDAFELLGDFEDWAAIQEERHQVELRAVSRSSYEGAMEIRSRYEAMLRHVTDICADAESAKRISPFIVPR